MQDNDISQTDQYHDYVFAVTSNSHQLQSGNCSSLSSTAKNYTVYVAHRLSKIEQLPESSQSVDQKMPGSTFEQLFKIKIPNFIIVDSGSLQHRITEIESVDCNEVILCGTYQTGYQDAMQPVNGWWAYLPAAILADCDYLILTYMYTATETGKKLMARTLQDFVNVPTMTQCNNQICFGQFTSQNNQNKVVSSYLLEPGKQKVSPSRFESEIRWESQLELRYTISRCLNRHVYSRAGDHHCLILNNQSVVHVFNREKQIHEMISFYAERGQDRQAFMDWLLQMMADHRLRHPLKYYMQIYDWCVIIANATQMSISSLKSEDYIKLIKYAMIECIGTVEVVNWLLDVDSPPNTSKLPDQQNEDEDQRLCVIKQLSWKQLRDDPINETLIIYWILGVPGCSKTQIYAQTQAQIESCCAQSIIISSTSQEQVQEAEVHKRMSDFLQRTDLFQYERLAYIMLDISFNPSLLSQTLTLIENILSSQIHYEFYLIAPQQPIASELEQISSYFFSFDYLLCAILNAQRRNNHQGLTGHSVLSLAKMLYYVSSTYSNLSLDRLIATENFNRNLGVIRYSLANSNIMIKEQNMGILEKQEVYDCLRVLLDVSYKGVVQEDSLLYYFLEMIEQIQEYHWDINGVADQILCGTFQVLPYIDFRV